MNSYSCCSEDSCSSHISKLVALLKLVSEESRLKLLCILQTGEHCVCEMEEHGNFSQSLISHHLKDLKKEGLVTDTKKGLRVYYALTTKGKNIVELLFQLLAKEVESK